MVGFGVTDATFAQLLHLEIGLHRACGTHTCRAIDNFASGKSRFIAFHLIIWSSVEFNGKTCGNSDAPLAEFLGYVFNFADIHRAVAFKPHRTAHKEQFLAIGSDISESAEYTRRSVKQICIVADENCVNTFGFQGIGYLVTTQVDFRFKS